MLLKKRFLLGLGTVASLLVAQFASAHILVIGSKDSGVKHLTANQVANVFMGAPSLAMNQQFKPYDQPSYSQAYKEFCQKVLHKSPDQMNQYWAAQTFKGNASAPEQLTSINQLFSLIANYPSVIGYVDSDQVPASYLQNVRVFYGGSNAQPRVVKKAPVVKKVAAPAPAPVAAAIVPTVVKKKAKPAALPKEVAPGVWGQVLASTHWDSFYKHPGVQEQIKRFGSKADLQHRITNATPYINYVFNEAKKMGVPSQFALLPLMESNYDPTATNDNGAGLWQLERRTAEGMGVPVNSRYDGRQDISVSTRAALEQLLQQFKRFHNWQLAAAAYNCGQGRVEKAVEHNIKEGKPTNFWAIRSQLPHITQAYVPRLIALSYMLNHALHFGVTLPNLPVSQTIQTTPVKQELSFAQISQLSGASTKELKKLNPGLLDGKTEKDGTYQLMLPVSAVNDFRENLNSMNQLNIREAAEKKREKAALIEKKREKAALIERKHNEAVLAKREHKEEEIAKKKEAVQAARVAKAEELASYQVTHAPVKKQSSDEGLKSLLSKIYDH